jgi:hypothetical protein
MCRVSSARATSTSSTTAAAATAYTAAAAAAATADTAVQLTTVCTECGQRAAIQSESVHQQLHIASMMLYGVLHHRECSASTAAVHVLHVYASGECVHSVNHQQPAAAAASAATTAAYEQRIDARGLCLLCSLGAQHSGAFDQKRVSLYHFLCVVAIFEYYHKKNHTHTKHHQHNNNRATTTTPTDHLFILRVKQQQQ